MDLNDPAFPHGRDYGYVKGCRKTYPCPATPTCNDAHSDARRASRARAKADKAAGADIDGLLRFHVLRRLGQTLAAVDRDQLLDHIGWDAARLDALLAGNTGRIPWDDSEPLDAAWALFARGVDTTKRKHGTQTSYTHWCRCRRCVKAATRASKRASAGMVTANCQVREPETIAAVREKANRLLDLAPRNYAADAVGIAPQTLAKATEGHMTYATAAKIKAFRLADLAVRESGYVPNTETQHIIRTHAALGYPITWQSNQAAGNNSLASRIIKAPTGEPMYAGTAQAFRDLAARLGGQVATPRPGLSQQGINYVLGVAARSGWYPPEAYDENRQLILRALPDHPWSKLDESAAKKVLYVWHLSRGTGGPTACKLVGYGDGGGDRAAHGLTYVKKFSRKSGRYVSTEDLDLAASADRIKQIADVVWQWESGQIGPVTAALTLGLNPAPKGGFGHVHRQHPEWVAWYAEHPSQSTESIPLEESVNAA